MSVAVLCLYQSYPLERTMEGTGGQNKQTVPFSIRHKMPRKELKKCVDLFQKPTNFSEVLETIEYYVTASEGRHGFFFTLERLDYV